MTRILAEPSRMPVSWTLITWCLCRKHMNLVGLLGMLKESETTPMI